MAVGAKKVRGGEPCNTNCCLLRRWGRPIARSLSSPSYYRCYVPARRGVAIDVARRIVSSRSRCRPVVRMGERRESDFDRCEEAVLLSDDVDVVC